MLRLRHFLLENRVDFVKKRYPEISTSHDAYATHRDPGPIVDHFAEKADPTRKKQYTDWIVNRYHKGDFRQEDHARIHSALSDFERYKPRLERKDINQYKKLSDVEDAVEPHLGGAASNKEAKRAVKDEGADKIFDDGKVTVHHIKTHDAACRYGAHTKWCTTARDKPQVFNEYASKGPIHVIQADGRKWQLHHDSNQLMDEKDEPVEPKELMGKYPQIRGVLGKSLSPQNKYAWASHFMVSDEEKRRFLDKRMDSPHIVDHLDAASQSDFHDYHDQLIDHEYSSVRAAVAEHGTNNHRHKLLTDDEPFVRSAVAEHGTEEQRWKLSTDEDQFVRGKVAEHCKTELAAQMLGDDKKFVRCAIARSHRQLAPLLHRDKDAEVRQNAAKWPEVAARLVNDNDERVRNTVASWHEHLARKLVGDESVLVRQSAATHPALARHFVDDPNSTVRYQAAIFAGEEHAPLFAKDRDSGVRGAVASKKSAASLLLQDPDKLISHIAHETLGLKSPHKHLFPTNDMWDWEPDDDHGANHGH